GVFFFSSRRRHTSFSRDWSSDVCSSDMTRTRPRGTWHASASRCRWPGRPIDDPVSASVAPFLICLGWNLQPASNGRFFFIWGKGKDRAGEVSGGQRQGVLELDRGIAQHLQVDALLAGDQLLGAHEVHRGVDAFRRLEHAVEQPEDAELAAGRIAAYHGLIAFE